MARGIHHIALGARDVAGVAAFYRDVLGLEEVARHSDEHGGLRSIWLGSGESVLMVERTEEPPRSVQGVGAGPFLVAFRVTAEEREGLEGRLSVESRTEHSSYFRDPEGNRVAISHYPLPQA